MRLLCFGDSNTWGYDPRSYFGGRYPADERWVDVLAALTGFDCVNLGENGRAIPRGALNVAPGAGERLIIMLGTNDLLEGAAAPECAARLERCLAGRGDDTLIVAPVPLTRGSWVASDALVDESRALAPEYAAAAARLGARFADAARWGVGLCFDGVHFTGEGHRAFARGLAEEIKRWD